MTDIRDAREADAAAVAAVQVASWRVAYRGLLPDDVLDGLSVEVRTEFWADLVHTPRPGTSLLVARVDGAIVGYAAVGADRLRALYVHPEHWREGVGTLLHDEAMERLGLLGCTDATLWMLEGNERAHAFHLRSGWVDTGQRQVDEGPGGTPLHEHEFRYTGALRPPFVPAGFTVPLYLIHPEFRLEPLGPEHNDADLAAWTGSIPHIRTTPGFAGRNWPPESGMSEEANLADLRKHAADFVRRIGFTYTVLDPAAAGDVIGCVYIYPTSGYPTSGADASVRSWVRADRAELDPVLHAAVTDWLRTSWPFGTVDYAPRADASATPALGAGGEAATLVEFLAYKRQAVITKALNLPDDAAHRPGVPSGTSLAWLVKHLTVSERFWFGGNMIDDLAAAAALAEGDTVPDLVAGYEYAALESDAIIAGWTDLDQVVETPANGRPRCTARWIIQHMITETARHAGHADILREQIDGAVGR